jgi:hypothetical protein
MAAQLSHGDVLVHVAVARVATFTPPARFSAVTVIRRVVVSWPSVARSSRT